MSRKIATLVSIALLSLAIPLGARASHCGSPIVVFSYPGGTAAVNGNAGVCAAFPDDHFADTRLINPGSTVISVRFTNPNGAVTAATISGTLDGLGYAAQSITLTRRVLATGSVVYDSPTFSIDPTASGAVTATVALPNGTTLSNCFHTVGAECADFGA